jgi:hypothetical protein
MVIFSEIHGRCSHSRKLKPITGFQGKMKWLPALKEEAALAWRRLLRSIVAWSENYVDGLVTKKKKKKKSVYSSCTSSFSSGGN